MKYRVTGRRGRRRKQLLEELKENRGYWKLKDEALENPLSKRLWICRKADCGMINDYSYLHFVYFTEPYIVFLV
jgi:hypothetical protein